jgi:hypothetical protein
MVIEVLYLVRRGEYRGISEKEKETKPAEVQKQSVTEMVKRNFYAKVNAQERLRFMRT